MRTLPRTLGNVEDAKQLVRSSGSVAANQIEADDPLGPKDRLLKFRTCRKEARESGLWLRLLHADVGSAVHRERIELVDEARQLTAIYSAIIQKLME